jgi:hypothetical protein
MTQDGLNELGQTIQKMVPKGAAWVMVMIPAHDSSNHRPGECTMQTVGNVGEDEAQLMLEGAARMYQQGTHDPFFARPVEKAH